MAKAKQQDKPSGTPAVKVEVAKRRNGKGFGKNGPDHRTEKVTGKTILGYSKARFDRKAGITQDTLPHHADLLRVLLHEKLLAHRTDKRARSAAQRRANSIANPSLPYEVRSANRSRAERNADTIKGVAAKSAPKQMSLPEWDGENLSVFPLPFGGTVSAS